MLKNALWNKDTTRHDNRVVNIGTYFAIASSKPIKNYFASDVLFVVTNNGVIVLNPHQPFLKVQSTTVLILVSHGLFVSNK